MSLPHSAPDLQKLYQKRFEGQADYRKGVWRILVRDFFQQWIPKQGAVLDLGCGHCEFINQVEASVRYAMDLNPEARQNALSPIQVLLQDCSTPWPLPEASLDVVFSSNFFEHLPTKAHLEATLVQALRCLRPGGKLIALGPNIRYVPGAYWDFFDHYIELTERSLAEVLEKVGFEIETQVGRFLPYSMSQGRTPPLWTLRLYLKLKPAWRLAGKQFLVIARKR